MRLEHRVADRSGTVGHRLAPDGLRDDAAGQGVAFGCSLTTEADEHVAVTCRRAIDEVGAGHDPHDETGEVKSSPR